MIKAAVEKNATLPDPFSSKNRTQKSRPCKCGFEVTKTASFFPKKSLKLFNGGIAI